MMKKTLILYIILLISIISCSKKSSNSDNAIAYLSGGAGEWVLKIDNLTINQTNFNNDLVASLKAQGANDEQVALAKNDSATKQYYSELLIRDILLLNKADEEKFFDTEEAKATINAAIRSLKAQYYLQSLMVNASKNIPEPTEEQAKAFFEQAKSQLAMYGINEYNKETAPYIAQAYKQSFSSQSVERQIQDLKDKSIIEKNNAILGQVDSLPQTSIDNSGNTNLLPRETN